MFIMTPMKLRSSLLVTAALTLAGCGGGGGSTQSTPPPPAPAPAPTPAPAATPAPSPAPTPTPTPTPPPQAEVNLLPPLASQTFAATSVDVRSKQNISDKQVTEFGGAQPSSSRVTVAYDASRGSYTLTDTSEGRSAVFVADPLSGDTSTTSEAISASQLTLLRNFPQNSVIAPSYLTYGLWSQAQADVDTTKSKLDAQVFIMGVDTPAANMPRSGTATYGGVVDGLAAISGVPLRLAGSTGTLGADFATGSIVSTLFLTGNTRLDGTRQGTNFQFEPITFQGAMTSNTNRFAGNTNASTYSGTMLGGFYGPSANEAGYAFDINATGGTSDGIRGVFVGKR